MSDSLRKQWARTASTLALLLAGCLSIAGMGLAAPQAAHAVTIANTSGAGYAMYIPQAGHYTWLGAFKDPSGKADAGISWCTEIDAVAPGPHEYLHDYELVSNQQIMPLGGEDITIGSAAQMAWILKKYEAVNTADSRAAIAAIVHLNYDATNKDSWVTYWGEIQKQYPNVAKLTRQYIAEAKAASPHSYTSSTVDGAKDKEGKIYNIGVYSQANQWVAGIPVTVILKGPAVFKANGKDTWTGTSQAGPIELEWVATGNGTVTYATKFNFDGTVNHLQSKPGFQNMLFNRNDPTDHYGPTGEFDVENIKLKTTAMGAQDKVVPSLPNQKITDTVCYTNLIAGKEYTLNGELTDKATGKALMAQATGKPYEATKTFKPEKAEGCVDMVFDVDGRDLIGKTTVVFEDLIHEGKSVATHADIEDHDQTIPPPPTVKTTAMGSTDGDKFVAGLANQKVFDKVCYDSLIPGKEYTLAGTLMNQSTGKPLTAKATGKSYTATKTFTPEAAKGCEMIEFTVDGRDLTSAPTVVFEDLHMGKLKVATHADIKDKDQTIPPAPGVKTTAKDGKDGDKEIAPKGNQTITDKVCYTNLDPAKEYTLTGTLMDKATGKPLTANGKPVSETITHKPTKANDCVDVTFTVDATHLAGHDIVVFESLAHNDREIAVHADIEDKGQTVHVNNPPQELAKTGASAAAVGLFALFLIGSGISMSAHRRKATTKA
ncbi:VaFE repeat-containing surface-anchored protein [Nanchangia anserum]|uniref:VaFE repeat-containing surface-anchored protein n=1 Tax=Nanchangia anserum TaxID=2692125 RepID=A0A8I0KW88_9ACTO|nr:VaFE repeat-containing surface-anchored protein [Nanchangia anserum]MBD3689754.1 VaFE repeat-containing surface-anchored protein [Nanchangia anserum]QOX81924.1 VaFE repeat-containing surface-anchored protein [Nanchangia anserum]